MANRLVTQCISDVAALSAVLANMSLNPFNRIIEWASTTTVTVKGSNYIGFELNSKWWLLDTDTTVSTANDMDTSTISNGKDYFVYACDDSGTLVFKISLDSTYPTGFTAATSRKIGGFHTLCTDVGTITGHILTGYTANSILPQSVWDLKHRPISEPAGMVWSEAAQVWVDIYLASGTGTSTASVNGGTISNGRNWMDFIDDFGAVKKQLLDDIEFQLIADGTAEEANIWTTADPVTTGGNSAYFLLTLDVGPSANWAAADTLTGGTSGYTCTVIECLTNLTYICKNMSNAAGFTDGEVISNGTNSADQGAGYPTWAANSKGRMISNIGCEDCASAVWQWLRDQSYRLDGADFAAAKTWAWYDLPGAKGSLHRQADYGDVKLIAGGHWDDAAYCGSRCRAAYHSRWYTSTAVGGRGRSRKL